MRNKILNLLDILSNLKWDYIFRLQKIRNRRFKIIINNNSDLKNKHKGKRCFIVGNGPSLRKMDLSKLHNELTFSVNNIMHDRNIYESLNTDYHILIDPLYFRLNLNMPEDLAIIELIKSINYQNKQPICITSIEGYESFQNNGLANHINFRYLYQHRNLTENFIKDIDLTKNIPSSQNVIQAAIFAALYMGCKEIYLIGCDMTSLFSTFESDDDGKKNIKDDNHVYKYNENEKKFILKGLVHNDNEFMLYDYAKTFTIFKRIERYTQTKNIKIFNAGIGGGLDMFERVKYETLFESKN